MYNKNNDVFQPQAVLFDWDGTLVDTLPFLLEAHNHVRTQMGCTIWSVDEFKGHVRYSSGDLYTIIYEDQADTALNHLKEFMDGNHLNHLDVLPDALDLLQFLKKSCIPSALISNKRHDFLLREVSHLGWEHFFESTIGAGFASKDKPSPDPLWQALEDCQLKSGKDIWYVGDSETDIRAAHAAGCSAVLIRHHHDNEHLIEEFNPEIVFDDCRALQECLISYKTSPFVKKG